ncbi:TIGR01906 family membrane protein [Arthrobacter sp. Z1-15]
MASQDDTPQQKPTPEGSADTGRERTESGSGDGLSDASETIVSGDHAAGTGAEAPAAAGTGAAGTDASTAEAAAGNTKSGPADDGLDHDDWDAAFADATGTPADAAVVGAETRGSAAGADGDVVPGGHPSLAQRSSLPMRRASTMPNLSGYADLSEEELKQAGDINATLPPSGSHAAGGSGTAGTSAAAAAAPETAAPETAAPEVTASEAAASDTAATGTATADATAGATPLAAAGAGAVAGSAAAASGASAAAPQTARISTSAGASPSSAADTGKGTGDADPDGPQAGEDTPVHRDADDEISEEEARRRAEERERAGAAKPVLARILQVMIAVFFPVMLLAAAIRAVATPVFLWIEYHRPGFPADSYGFSTDDRMTYGSYAVDYLLNFAGARYLGDLVTTGGEPLYLESEVSHMADVKTVLTIAFVSALAMAVLSLLACVYLAKRSPGGIRRALFSGAVLTLVLVGALIVTAVLGWESFFTQVHTIFFANGNWTFRMDDTLIRLFPAQFWMDAGIAIAALVLLTCLIVLVCAWPTKARRERARSKQEAARRRYLDSLEAV